MTDRERLTALLMAGAGDFISKNGALNCTKLADYLLANGVIVPPCYIGNAVYTKSGSKRIVERIEVGRVYNPERYFYIFTAYSNKTLSKGYLRFFDYEIGKTVFLTREEAEQALKERENNG